MARESGDRPTETWIEERLSAEGIRVSAIEPVSKRPDRFEIVYRVTTDTGGSRYVRTLSEPHADALRSLLSSGVAIDMPETGLIDGAHPLLIMEVASGSPLSIVLPIYLLPGLWSWEQSDLISGVRSLGRNLGTLHTETTARTAPFGESEIDSEKIQNILDDVDGLGFETSTSATVSETLPELLRTGVVHAMTHRDPTPHNVYYDSGNIELIDFDLSVRPVLVDVALAEIGIRLMVARLPYARKSQATELIEGFWEGYRSAGIDIALSGDLYRSTRIYQLCELQRNYVDKHDSSLVSRLTAITDRSTIREFVREDCVALRG